MALGSTQFGFEIELSDMDRGVYETLQLPASCHPSESEAYLVCRVLAHALEQREGLAFGQGLSAADQPAVWAHDLTGSLTAWIEIGTPDADRLHRASKACDDVAVYCHKDLGPYLQQLAGKKVHRSEHIRLIEVPKPLISWLAERLQRRNKWVISRTEGELFVEVGDDTTTAHLVEHPWP